MGWWTTVITNVGAPAEGGGVVGGGGAARSRGRKPRQRISHENLHTANYTSTRQVLQYLTLKIK
jgi:hypothetical protein